MRPTEVVATRYIYSAVLQDKGIIPLDQLIMEHLWLRTDRGNDAIACFAHFVKALLTCNHRKRPSAEQALAHPFITGQPFDPEWRLPEAPRAPVLAAERQQAPYRLGSMYRLGASDFLSLI